MSIKNKVFRLKEGASEPDVPRLTLNALSHKPSDGMALVIVLASLVFLVTLSLAFLVSVSTELNSSKVYSQGANAKLLAQTAVNLATAQIADAARGEDAGGNTLAWASQPGMIRTYDTSGQPAGYFRLFSWTDMSGAGAFDHTLPTNAVPTDWSSQKAVFTDLNQPLRLVANAVTNSVYPIIDGNNLTTMAAVGGNKTYGTGNTPAIDGFYVSTNSTPVAPAANANPVPMPVKWLYVLEDGKVVAPTPDPTGTKVTVAGADTSPIVGRIAFWADDETCKININTASDGSYWDMPRAYGSAEHSMARNQSVRGEFQRYPAHPATTSLSTVIKKPNGSPLSDAQWADLLYGVVPRVKTGGSYWGTVQTTQMSPLEITPDPDRLFATVDELIFRADTVSGARPVNDLGAATATVLSNTTLERAKFFLTANNRSPDLSLFNKPRVCIWPLNIVDDDKKRTVYDKLIAFCSTMRGDLENEAYRYYFQRADPTSPTNDLPPGGAVTGLGRNRMLLEYLRTLTSSNIPGVGGSFLSKYGADNDQILTQIFDYVRSTNLRDSLITVSTDKYTSPVNQWGAGTGQVVPIEDTTTGTRGFGRFRTVQGASLLFIGRGNSSSGVMQKIPGPNTAVPADHMRVQAMFIPQLFDTSVGTVFDSPNFKWEISGLNAFQWDPGTGMESMGFPATVTKSENYYAYDGCYYGDQFGLRQAARQAPTSNTLDIPYIPPDPIAPTIPRSFFAFKGGDVTIKIMTMDNTVVQTVTLRFPDGSWGDATTFPVPDLPPDQVYNYDWNGGLNQYFPGPWTMRSFSGRNGAAGNGVAWVLKEDTIRSVSADPGDIRLIAARKDVPTPGDAGYPFAPNAKYGIRTVHVMGAHNFFSAAGQPHYGAALGRLVAGASYSGYASTGTTANQLSYPPSTSQGGQISDSSASDIPLNGVAVGKSTSFVSGNIPGDWDSGPFTIRDGPYINKADEGDIGNTSGDIPYSWKGRDGADLVTSSMFTANRQIPSAVTFGSLPTGVLANRPWQTLLFRPDTLGDGSHPGSKNRKGDGTVATGMPADHRLLDLFHMPVVEPYAISEPLATAGRINMNYQIVPFTYINRETGIRAVLKNEKVISIADNQADRYKVSWTSSPAQAGIRFPVNLDETLKGFTARFNSDKDIFRSASEICEIPIVPVDPASSNDTYSTMPAYWNASSGGHRLTGDNSKERIYATVYPRLTTKSNTFTIHYRAQSLKKVNGGTATVWDEAKDKVTGEYRGSQTIERYIDPNDDEIPDYANPADPDKNRPISDFYKTRILQAKQFAP